MKKKILIAGGSGLVGTELRKILENSNFQVYILTTNLAKKNQNNFIYWNPAEKKIELNQETDFEAIVNLAGENIGSKFWTQKRKLELVNSRVFSTLFLNDLILQNKIKTNYFVQTSAIGFYGNRGSVLLDESAAKGDGFLSDVCQVWEASLEELTCPFSIFRLGIVLDKNEGAFPKLILGIKYRLATILGDGSNFISWISLEDTSRLISFLIEKKSKGIFNAVSSQPIPTISLIDKYIKYLGLNLVLKMFIPKFLLKFLLGQMSELFLNSQNVSSKKISDLGFDFKHNSIEDFLLDLSLNK